MLRNLFVIVSLLVLLNCKDKNGESRIIYRDTFNVPHAWGNTDSEAVYAFAWAQMEDNFAQVEYNFIRSTGQASKLLGSEEVYSDWLLKKLDIINLSIKEYNQLPYEIKNILKAYASAYNKFTEKKSTVKLDRIEPWAPLALIKYLYYQNGFFYTFLSEAEINDKEMSESLKSSLNSSDSLLSVVLYDEEQLANQGSNSWGINGVKSISGNALLFINPHLPFFGQSQVYEGHVMSESGWNFTGYTRFGFPFPYVGFNENLGWASTDNDSDLVDVYEENIITINNEIYQVYQNDTIRLVERIDSVYFKSKYLKFSVFQSNHGPLFNVAGKYYGVKMAKFGQSGWLEQWYKMTKSNNKKSFDDAVGELDMLFGNYLYADKEGNIHYVYNGAVPVRDTSFNWRSPVRGDISATEWKGYHRFEELPQVLNPTFGWVQNCNGTPFLSANPLDNPNPNIYPNYMVKESDNKRHYGSRKIVR